MQDLGCLEEELFLSLHHGLAHPERAADVPVGIYSFTLSLSSAFQGAVSRSIPIPWLCCPWVRWVLGKFGGMFVESGGLNSEASSLDSPKSPLEELSLC